MIVNKRDVTKTAILDERPATWTSKYGSVTFNQYGREFPCGGINEAGLVVEVMWLEAAEYPAPDSRFGLTNLQWIQYQLDNHSTVEEVLASDAKFRIRFDGVSKVHYLVCDAAGECASIEFLAGKLVSHTADTPPVKVLTNSTYASSLEFLKQHQGFGGVLPIGHSQDSLDRFVRAADMLARFDAHDAESAIEYGFTILAEVAQGDWTKWSIVRGGPITIASTLF